MEMYNFDKSQYILYIEYSVYPRTESQTLKYLFCIIDFNRSIKCPNYDIPTIFTSEIICTSTHAFHSCLLTIEGVVHCFSNNKNEPLDVPTSMILQNITDISIGFNYRCYLTSVNYLVCNGVNTFGVLSTPSDMSESLTFIGTGMTTACTRNMTGLLKCWGSGQDGLLDIPGRGVALDVQVGNRHACYVSGWHKMWCWGSNAYGQADGEGVSAGKEKEEERVGDRGEIKMLKISLNGEGNRLAYLLKGGKVNKNKNKKEKELTPKTPNYIVKTLSTGGSHTCYLLSTDSTIPQPDNQTPFPINLDSLPFKLVCTGLNADGQCSVPLASLNSSSMVSAGQKHSCSISHLGSVLCWGIINTFLPAAPHSFYDQFNKWTRKHHEPAINITSGMKHACAHTFKLNAYCWGSDKDGQVEMSKELQTSQMIYGVYTGWNETIVVARDGSTIMYGKSTWDNDQSDRSLIGYKG
eukprot:Mrub_02987.p1 GENE.Mrub_02987~~Mrub_02987.p1  ORF type:complete len:486 (+),score=151.30 Mrub_02987:61-1458(+)